MMTSLSIKTFVLFLLSQVITTSLSIWCRYLGWYFSSVLIIAVPLVIISIMWPICLRNRAETISFKDVLKSSIAGISGIVVANVIVYLIWYYVSKDGDLSNLWGKDFDVFKVELYFSLLLFIVLYLFSLLVVGKRLLKLFMY